MKNNKLISAIDGIDDKDLEEARPRGRAAGLPIYYRIGAIAACFVMVVSVVLFAVLMGGTAGNGGETNPPVSGIPFPDLPTSGKSLSAVISDYLLNGDDGFDWSDDGFVEDEVTDGIPGESSPEIPNGGNTGGAGDTSGGANGSYVETTDNQVEGIIEADLCKTTDKYIFRYTSNMLSIYSIDGYNSSLISSLEIYSRLGGYYADMFLSQDGNTVTLIRQDYDAEDNYSNIVKIYSIDVSDVSSPRVAKTVTLAGLSEAVRKIGDSIYLVNAVSFYKKNIDLDKPESYIPGVEYEDGTHLCDTDSIYYPDELTSVVYRYITVFNEGDLSLADEYAILTDHQVWPTDVYFTDNHIAIGYQDSRGIAEESIRSQRFTTVDLIDFTDGLRYRGRLEMNGWADNQYYFDEHNGYLRVVTSTRQVNSSFLVSSNASLYVFDLSTMTLTASVESFAPDGERATAVRFEGDKLYVCTAETSSFTDPVFFFDLSDYENITQVNTGFIDGFSSSLIDLGDGFLLGIGRESRAQGKVEVYKREGDAVVSVAEYLFYGTPGSNYKSYLIDREKNLFGFACNNYRASAGEKMEQVYVILHFDGEGLCVAEKINISAGDLTCRAFYRDGFVYLTSQKDFAARKLNGITD